MLAHRLRLFLKLIPLPLVTVLLASHWLLHPLSVEAQGSQKSKLRELQEQRLAILRDLVAITREHYKNGEVSYDELILATKAKDEAELALCTSTQERIAILERLVAGAKELEGQAAKLAANKLVSKRACLKATADRLQQEILLEQARGK